MRCRISCSAAAYSTVVPLVPRLTAATRASAKSQLLMAQSCFVVFVPEAEPLVATLRLRFDESAGLGVPAHITLLFPFMDPQRIDAHVLDQCAAILSGHGKFTFQLSSVGRFPAAAYLKPEPPEPFIALTHALTAAFPEFPPYRGEFENVIPHLTVAHGKAHEAQMASDALALKMHALGPVSSMCAAVTLIENSSGRWRTMHAFPLG
jgi:2'-5' RNA ligase